MDEVTQQNSALVEQNAATAKTLEHQALAMSEHSNRFQLAEPGEARPAQTPAAGRPHAHPARQPQVAAAARPQAAQREPARMRA